jgi:hypothetical protein
VYTKSDLTPIPSTTFIIPVIPTYIISVEPLDDLIYDEYISKHENSIDPPFSEDFFLVFSDDPGLGGSFFLYEDEYVD